MYGYLQSLGSPHVCVNSLCSPETAKKLSHGTKNPNPLSSLAFLFSLPKNYAQLWKRKEGLYTTFSDEKCMNNKKVRVCPAGLGLLPRWPHGLQKRGPETILFSSFAPWLKTFVFGGPFPQCIGDLLPIKTSRTFFPPRPRDKQGGIYKSCFRA